MIISPRKWLNIKYLYYFGLLWALGVTLFRAFRFPNDWAEAHWLFVYDFGLVKRGLMGTAFEWFIAPNGDSQYAEARISFLSTVVLITLLLILVMMMIRLMTRFDFSADGFLITVVFFTSPYLAKSIHLNGYFDNLFVPLTFFAVLLALKGHSALSALIVALGILAHETTLLVGFPSVLFAALLSIHRDIIALPDRRARWGVIIKRLLPFLLPMMIFLVMFIYQNYFIDVADLRRQLTAHIREFGIVKRGRASSVPFMNTRSFYDALKAESPSFVRRLTSLECLVQILPTLTMVLVMAGRTLKHLNLSKWYLLIGTMISLSPLLIHLAACDTHRIWSYPLLAAIFLLWTVTEAHPQKLLSMRSSILFQTTCVVIIVANSLFRIKMMDGVVDKYSTELRMVLYLPVFIVVAIAVSRDNKASTSTQSL
jgi:hypothetical protein